MVKYYYSTNNKILKNLLTVVHIIIHNGGKIETYPEASSIAFKTTKPL